MGWYGEKGYTVHDDEIIIVNIRLGLIPTITLGKRFYKLFFKILVFLVAWYC